MAVAGAQEGPLAPGALTTYVLKGGTDAAAYDEAVAVATVQGLLNRDAPQVYLFSAVNPRPQYWWDRFSRPGGWLASRRAAPVADLDGLVRRAGAKLRGAVVWDPAVPATVNVATTLAGVRDAIVLSPELAARHLADWRLPVLEDLRGRFTGAETGSRKNDAYRWAVRELLAKGLCSSRFLCLYHDAFGLRERGQVGYAVTRDWAVRNRAFVFDLSPWGDECPADDPGQRRGLDLETYRMILAETRRGSGGRHLTELTGFFSFEKYSHFGGHASAHEPVPTEWETVRLISPYLVYQNTSTSDCYNQSLHCQAPRVALKQVPAAPVRATPGKTYLCLYMADYDSAYVLYDYLPKFWDDPNRGRVPLAWGLNPNLRDTYPDLVAHFYATMTPADTITADAGAAGYINPTRIAEADLPQFVRHNRAYFREADLAYAPMVLDWAEPTPAVKDAFQAFAPKGLGSMVWDMHTNTGHGPAPHVWRGMPVLNLLNEANEFPGPERTADIIATAIAENSGGLRGFYLFRIVWTSPTQILEMLAALRARHPQLDIEVLDLGTFYRLAGERLAAGPAT